MRSGLIAALLLGASLPAAAQAPAPAPNRPVTAGDLAAACGGTAAEAIQFCRGFLVGAGQYHAEVTRPGGHRPLFCLPDPPPSLDQAVASFAAWGRANPQHAADKAVDGLMRWAAVAYPCPNPPARRARQR